MLHTKKKLFYIVGWGRWTEAAFGVKKMLRNKEKNNKTRLTNGKQVLSDIGGMAITSIDNSGYIHKWNADIISLNTYDHMIIWCK